MNKEIVIPTAICIVIKLSNTLILYIQDSLISFNTIKKYTC